MLTKFNRKEIAKYLINTIAALIFFPVIDQFFSLLSAYSSGEFYLSFTSYLIILLGLLEIIWLLKFSYDLQKTQMKKAQKFFRTLKSTNLQASKEEPLKK